MRRLILFLAAAMASAYAQPATPRTLRLDYVHTGTAKEEQFALDGLALEGDWPGPLDRWIDETNLGPYRFQVLDPATRHVIYSRGFASLFGEWQEISEAKQLRRAFHESIRFPAPASPVEVVIQGRAPDNEFRDLWSMTVDPSDASIDRSAPPKLKVWSVVRNGTPRDKVDLLLLGDGYTTAEMDKWHRDARRTTEQLFAVSPFKEHKQDFNVWAIDTPAEESGVSRPSDGIYRHSPVGASYDAFGSERYVLTFENKRLRQIAAAAPYEFIEIVVNGRKYGGGGIFNLYATVSSDNAFTPYVFVHEFGHHFAGLADEYYTSDVAYASDAKRPEPWAPNATADSHAAKWVELLTPGIELPTPWPKQEFEEMEQAIQKRRRQIRAEHRPEEEMEKLFAEERSRDTKLLASGPNAGKVGAFEGALYEARGYYRPQQDCIMFTRDEVGFCAVCRHAIERIIKLYAR
ncbi:MAG TPA: IgA Peptidase M64 [Bryobacteraceae bacterium]|nr:IgA Peptidase M64 [Bryobacteraceae bacterium]